MRSLSLFIVGSILSFNLSAQRVATFEVEVNNSGGLVSPAKIDLNGITALEADQLILYRVDDGNRKVIPFQISRNPDGGRELLWLVTPGNKSKILYELGKGRSSVSTSPVTATKEDGALTLAAQGHNLLRYQYERVEPPAGAEASYGRGAFIHPLWAPRGQVLTRIQPADHYHHYGIWNPWTHVLYDGDTLDFWNLNKKEGTVRFAEFPAIAQGSVFAEYTALHEHVVLKGSAEKVALNELQTVRVYHPADLDYYIMEITSKMTCATEEPFRILAYRYAGLGWRTTEKWDNSNSEVLTSEGKTRKDADGSTARWCLVQGAVDGDYAGALMMSHPLNYNHPEPLRIWPENQYGRGDMFANFSPTKNRDWELLPGKEYTLRYRFVVFNGKFTPEKSEAAWGSFAEPLKVSVKKR